MGDAEEMAGEDEGMTALEAFLIGYSIGTTILVVRQWVWKWKHIRQVYDWDKENHTITLDRAVDMKDGDSIFVLDGDSIFVLGDRK